MAASVLITDSAPFAQQVDEEVEKRYSITRNTDRVAQALQGKQSGIILVDDIPAAIRVADAYAPEHLEIQTHNAVMRGPFSSGLSHQFRWGITPLDQTMFFPRRDRRGTAPVYRRIRLLSRFTLLNTMKLRLKARPILSSLFQMQSSFRRMEKQYVHGSRTLQPGISNPNE